MSGKTNSSAPVANEPVANEPAANTPVDLAALSAASSQFTDRLKPIIQRKMKAGLTREQAVAVIEAQIKADQAADTPCQITAELVAIANSKA
ncbi:MAG: hypothetical protein E1N59_2839 [Puniceicoccaceae bacterium 5H]|nr:MAG: hypothetical protein E1N59_2839 [Puniceicoccaceae bacterium 5H]